MGRDWRISIIITFVILLLPIAVIFLFAFVGVKRAEYKHRKRLRDEYFSQFGKSKPGGASGCGGVGFER